MKNISCLPLVLFAIIIASCQKKNDKPASDAQEITITVLDKGTHKPIAGATVNLKKCGHYDYEFGCTSYQFVKYLTTDLSGTVRYPATLNIEAIEVAHVDYWKKFSKTSAGEILLSPEAWVKARLNRTGNYNSGSHLNISASKDCFLCYPNYEAVFGLPGDTTIVMKVEGTVPTYINWSVVSTTSAVINSGRTPPFVVNGFDTLKMTIEY